VLERGQRSAVIAVDEIEIIVLFQEDGGVLGQSQQTQQGQPGLVDVS
jgi:hypothetical protein